MRSFRVRASKGLLACAGAIFRCVFLFVVVDVVFFAHNFQRILERPLSLSNPTVFAWAALAYAALVAAFCAGERARPRRAKDGRMALRLATLAFFLLHFILMHNILFRTGWDVEIIRRLVDGRVSGEIERGSFNAYLSQYPNNIPLAALHYLILLANDKLGLFAGTGAQGSLNALVLPGSAVCAATGWLLHRICRKLSGKGSFAWLAWTLYVLLIGLSPWGCIPYSDALAILFPMLMLYFFLDLHPFRSQLRKWFAIGLSGAIGFQLKPIVAVMLIAIVAVRLCRLLGERLEGFKLSDAVLSLADSWLLATVLMTAGCVLVLGVSINRQASFGMLHYMQMGLNNERTGYYSFDDVVYSASFPTRKERNAGNLKLIRERLADFGFAGYLDFLHRKTAVNYDDGMFAWEHEGAFYYEMYDPVNDTLSPALRSLYYGDNKIAFADFEQVIWYFVLLGTLLFGLKGADGARPGDTAEARSVIMAALTGAFLFVTLFETRARYLYAFAPVHVLAATLGIQFWAAKLRALPGRLARRPGR